MLKATGYKLSKEIVDGLKKNRDQKFKKTKKRRVSLNYLIFQENEIQEIKNKILNLFKNTKLHNLELKTKIHPEIIIAKTNLNLDLYEFDLEKGILKFEIILFPENRIDESNNL
jgi:hypothetical protein